MEQLLKSRRIFIVEDNLANRAITQMLLESHGAVTAIEAWGTTTLHRLREFGEVDLILLDIMLPNGMSGFDIAEEIRSQSAYSCVPIVALTATDPAETIPIAQACGFAGFISKPIDFDEFPMMVARAIAGEALWN